MNYRGKLERLEGRTLHGWLWKVDELTPATARIHINGEFVGLISADRRRVDLVKKGIGSGSHAFRFVIPLDFCDGNQNRFELYAEGTSELLISALTSRVDIQVTELERQKELKAKNNAIETKYNQMPTISNIVNLSDGNNNTQGLGQEASPNPDRFKLTVADEKGRQTILTSAISCANEYWIKKVRVLPVENYYLHAKNKHDIDACVYSSGSDGFRICSAKPGGWLRILRACQLPDVLMFDEIRVSVVAHAKSESYFTVSILVCDDQGVFRLVHRFGRDRKLIEGENKLIFRMRDRRAMANFRSAATSQIFLCLETHHSFDLSQPILEINFLTLDEQAPYRASELQIHQRLAILNDNFSQEGKADVRRLVLETAEISVRLECYQTASALLSLSSINDFKGEAEKIRYLAIASDVMLAEGRIEELRDLLFENYALVQNSDLLISALTACLPPSETFNELLGVLPSGKLNRYFMSRVGLNGRGLRSLLLGTDGYQDGQSQLLLSTMSRELGPKPYIQALNNFLSRFNLSFVQSIDWNSENILSGLNFVSNSPSKIIENCGLVSVIISAFNSAETIEYSIRSILSQSYQNLEVLVCDDESSDATLNVVARFKDKRLKFYRSTKNQGPYNVRNLLMQRAQGAYVTFHDADDLAHPMRIERQLGDLVRSKARVCVGKWLRIRPNGDIAFFRDQMCLRPSVVSLMAEKNVFNELGHYRQSVCGADSELYERVRIMPAAFPFVEVDAPLIFGLWSSQSLTQQPGLEATEDGYRSAARRAYAELGARQRLLSPRIVQDRVIDQALNDFRIARSPMGLERASLRARMKTKLGGGHVNEA